MAFEKKGRPERGNPVGGRNPRVDSQSDSNLTFYLLQHLLGKGVPLLHKGFKARQQMTRVIWNSFGTWLGSLLCHPIPCCRQRSWRGEVPMVSAGIEGRVRQTPCTTLVVDVCCKAPVFAFQTFDGHFEITWAFVDTRGT